MLLAIVVLLNNSKELIILMTVKFLSQVKLSVISRNKHKSQIWLGKNMAMIERYYGDRTHKKIMAAVRAMTDYLGPIPVIVKFRGCDEVVLDYFEIKAYKVGKVGAQLTVRFEDLTPVEAFRLKRACRYTLERQLLEANERLSDLIKLQETFKKSHFGC